MEWLYCWITGYIFNCRSNRWRLVMKTYSVKDIREITGLTGKQLYEYKESIPGIGPMNDAGYKQYSQDDLEKLVQAALMAKLGAKPKDINKAFLDENYDRSKVLKELGNRARKKLVELKDIITITDFYSMLSNQPHLVNPYVIKDLHRLAEYMRKTEKDDDTATFVQYLENGGNERLMEKLSLFEGLREEKLSEEEAEKYGYEMYKFAEKELDISPNRFLMVIQADLSSIETLRNGVDKMYGEGTSDVAALCMGIYLFNSFFEESEDDLEKAVDMIGLDYDDERAKICIERIRDSFMRNMGFRNTYECLNNIEAMKYYARLDDDVDNDDVKDFDAVIDYISEGIRYYDEKSVSEMNDPSSEE